MPKLKKELTKEEQELFNELKKLSKRANQRIVRLERAFGKDTWATKYLKDKLASEPLQAWTISGRVRVNKSMTTTQMKATIKATKQFLNSNISTKRGIKKAKQKAIKTLQTRFSSDTEDVSVQEAEALYNFFEDKDVNGITAFIPGSDVIAIIENAREYNYNYETFVEMMNSYVRKNNGTGYDTIVRKIYAKYVYKGNENIEEVDIFYDNYNALIDNATTENELNELESIISNLHTEKKIESDLFNYLMDKINDKRKEI